MGKGELKVTELIPTPSYIEAKVKLFTRHNKFGFVTSIRESRIPALLAALEHLSDADVKPIGDVVRYFHRGTGLATPNLAPVRQFLSAIQIACVNLDHSSEFRRSASNPGFHETIRDTIRELGSWGFSPDSLAVLAEKCTGSLRPRLQEISAIWSEAQELLRHSGSCTVSQLIHECLESVTDTDGIAENLLVFVGGELRPHYLRWIQWVVDQGAKVEVVVFRHAQQGRVFHQAARSVGMLGAKSDSPGAANLLLSNLFANSPHMEGDRLDVKVRRMGDPLSECEWMVRKCLALDSPESSAIVIRDEDQYGALLTAMAQRHGLELDYRRRVPLLSNGFARAILGLLRAMDQHDVRPILASLESSYFSSRGTLSNLLAGIILVAHAQLGRQWESLADQVLEARRNFEGEEVADLAWLVVEYLVESREQAKEHRTLPEWHRYFKRFIEEGPWLDSVMNSETQGRDMRAFTVLCGTLGEDAVIQNSAEERKWSFSEWLEKATAVWDASDVSVPGTEQGVRVVKSAAELGRVDHLFVLGMAEGRFPRRRVEDPVLTDKDRAEMSQFLDGPPLESSEDWAKMERDYFYEICAVPEKSLHLSYPWMVGDSESIPAFYLVDVRRICEISDDEQFSRRAHTAPKAEAKSVSDLRLLSALESPRTAQGPNQTTGAVAKQIEVLERLELDPARFRDLNQCAFKFSASRLFDSPVTDRDNYGLLIRIPEMAGLLRQPTEESARRALEEMTEQFLDDISPQVPRWELSYLRKAAEQHMEGWIRREFDSRERWGRNWEDTKLGVRFGEEPLQGEVKRMKLLGKVAGVTNLGTVCTVHLYRRSAPTVTSEGKLDVPVLLQKFGLYMAAAQQVPNKQLRVEIEGIANARTMIVLAQDEDHVQSVKSAGLHVITLSGIHGNRSLFENLIQLRDDSLLRLKANPWEPSPGDHCQYCDVASLCRHRLSEDVNTEVASG